MTVKILTLKKNHNKLENNIEDTIHYGLELLEEKAKFLTLEKKAIIIEGLLLRACAYWEQFLETEIVYLVDIDQSKLKEELELPDNTNLNRRTIKAILFSNTYRSFHDIERSKSFFRTFIVEEYNLFKKLSNEQLNKSQMVYTLRNYLAHYSEFSEKKLRQEYKSTYGYSNFMRPGNFLMKKNGAYFESLIHNFCLMSATMKRGL